MLYSKTCFRIEPGLNGNLLYDNVIFFNIVLSGIYLRRNVHVTLGKVLILTQLLCFWRLSVLLLLFKTDSVLETGFCV
jgi:hypothetical protein